MTIYYVDQSHNSASDANSGTAASPWRTLQQAANSVKAGDTVYVKAGNYRPFKITKSGDADKHIVFSAYPGDEHDVVIDGNGTSVRGVIETRGQSYLTISGFRIQNAPVDGIFIEGSPAGSHDIRIIGNQIDTTGNSGIYAAGLIMGQTIPVGEYRLFDLTIANNEVTNTNYPDGGNEAISIGGGVNGFVIRNNWVHDSQQYGIDAKLGAINGEIHDNLIHDVEKHGIYLDANSRTIENVKIYNNVIFNNNNGIALARESTRDPKAPNIRDVEIYSNKVFDNAKYGIMAYKHKADVLTGDFDDVWIHDNDIAFNGTNGIHLVGIGQVADNFLVSDNALFKNGIDINNQIGAEVSKNTFNVQPDLTVPDAADVLEGGSTGGTPSNALPVITTADAVSIAENHTSILTVAASDADGEAISFGVAGGVDAAAFKINSTSGALSFVSEPDFEAPRDANGDNVYAVTVSASDGKATVSKAISVTVTDMADMADRFVFALIDAATDTVIDSDLSDGVTGLEGQHLQGPLTMAALPAEPGSISGSVELKLTGPTGTVVRTESSAPYALFGDKNGDYTGKILAQGEYTISATNAGETESVVFTLEPESLFAGF